MADINDVPEDQGYDEETLAAALELGRLVSLETGVCGEELGKLIFTSYQKLIGDTEESE